MLPTQSNLIGGYRETLPKEMNGILKDDTQGYLLAPICMRVSPVHMNVSHMHKNAIKFVFIVLKTKI